MAALLANTIHKMTNTAKPPHKEIKKTALGAQETVDWKYYPTTKEAIEDLRKNGYKVYMVEQVTNSTSLEKLADLCVENIAFIFGNEVTGVDQQTIILCDGCIEIPQFGMKHSLNISVAAGIVLWEAVKANTMKI